MKCRNPPQTLGESLGSNTRAPDPTTGATAGTIGRPAKHQPPQGGKTVMTTMRAKFRVNTITYYGDPENSNSIKEYGMSAVYDGRTIENLRFAKATPFGEMNIRVDNPTAAPLTIGEEYYLDITPCYQADAVAGEAEAAQLTYTREGRYTGDPNHGGYPDTTPRHAAPEDGTSKGYTDMTTTQPMDPAEITADGTPTPGAASSR